MLQTFPLSCALILYEMCMHTHTHTVQSKSTQNIFFIFRTELQGYNGKVSEIPISFGCESLLQSLMAVLTFECCSRTKCTLKTPEMLPDALLDVAKHMGNLNFNVWKKMQEIIEFSEHNKRHTHTHFCYVKGKIQSQSAHVSDL